MFPFLLSLYFFNELIDRVHISIIESILFNVIVHITIMRAVVMPEIYNKPPSPKKNLQTHHVLLRTVHLRDLGKNDGQ